MKEFVIKENGESFTFEKFSQLSKGGLKDKEEAEEKIPFATDSVQRSFKPIGFFAKCFGLFPCYDFSFNPDTCEKKIKFMHLVDYGYTGFICLAMLVGSILCIIGRPSIISKMKEAAAGRVDLYVVMSTFYTTLIMGILSLFIFPRSWCQILQYIEHFKSVDKLLQFPESAKKEEIRFGKKIVWSLSLFLIISIINFGFFFLDDLTFTGRCYTDFLMIPIESMAALTQVIPTAILIFFMNAIRIRLCQFNKKLEKMILPFLPSCFSCHCFSDYGRELISNKKAIDDDYEVFAIDLEKMRILHEEIVSLVRETSEVFGTHLLRDFFFSIISLILHSYTVIYIREYDTINPYIFWIIYPGFILFVCLKFIGISSYGHYLCDQAAYPLKILHKTGVNRLSQDCKLQIQLFIKKLDKPVELSASGYFTINRSLITAILGAITTYLVILMQFKLTDSKNMDKRKDCSNISLSDILDIIY